MKKTTLWLFLLIGFVSFSQNNISQDFPTTTTPTGWSNGGGSLTTTQACATASWRFNVYSTSSTTTNALSSETFVSTGEQLNVSFDYKVVDWSAATVATTPYNGTITVETSSNGGTTYANPVVAVNNANHVVANTCANVSVVIPGTSAPGGSNTKIRIKCNFGTSGDYYVYLDNVIITQAGAPACSGTPTPGNTLAPSSICFGSSALLSLENYTPGSGVTYQWYLNAVAIGSATSSTYTIPAVNSNESYYCEVTCGGNTTASTPVLVGPAILNAPTGIQPFATFLPTCWLFGDNGSLATGPATFVTNSWKNDGFGNVGSTGSIAYNHYGSGANDWIISPVINVPATGYELKFDAALTQWNVTTAPTTAWDAGDVLEVLVSNTGLDNWSLLYTIDNSNAPSPTGSVIAVDLDLYAAQNIRIAYRVVSGATDGADDTDISIDNFEIRLSPTCPDQTGLVVGNITASAADTSWDDMSAGGSVGYEYAVTTSATPPASGTSTPSTFYIASGLTPQTVYYLHVRSECAGSTFGNWSTLSFTTACAPITSLPWIENFDAVTTPALPSCWYKQNGDWQTSSATTYNTAHSGTKYLRNAYSATNEFMWTPAFDLVAGTSYDFSSWIQGDGETTWTVDFYVNNAQNSTGATQLGGQYVVPGPGTFTIQPYAQVTRSFVPATSGTYYFAFRVNEPSSDPWYLAIDDVELKLSPACPTTSASATAITDAAANLSWTAVPSANLGYEYVLDNVATDPVVSGTSTMVLSYSASGLNSATTYYFHIRSVCSAGTYSTWSTVSFTTLATPPANDNLCNATALTVGVPTGLVHTLVAATAETSEPAGTCFNGGINGSVWFSFVAPASGSVNVSTDFAGGTLEDGDTEIAVYAANGVTCSNLTTLGTALGCDQDSGTTVNYSSSLSLTSLVSGDTYYVQVDKYGGVASGTFGIQVSEVLSSNSFDTSNFVAYPNPVKDILNLSYKTAINNVKVVNVLGQEVLNTKANTNDVQVNMSALTAGAYIVNITVEDTVHTIKVIKQ